MADARLPYMVKRAAGYYEYQLPISVKLVVDYFGRIPLLRNERGEWELPGGKLELGETPEATARRETAEELGLTIEDVHIIDSWVYRVSARRHVFITSYGTIYRGDESPRLSYEHKDLELFGYDEIDSLRMPTAYQLTVARWRSRATRTP
jgi:8-oxo-dGTP pyrophosphatase MutT (NUDIX family)